MNQQMTWITLILYGFCFGSCLQFPLRKYYYVNNSLTWSEAQQYCREQYTDLATFESMDDINRLQPPFSYSWAWIGLWDDPNSWRYGMGNESNSWRWSTTGETSKTGFKFWASGNPNFIEAKEMCVQIYNGMWYDVSCDLEKTFICYTVTEHNVKQYVYISSGKTWSSAQTYCRTHYTDLAMIENQAEQDDVKKIIQNGIEVWIGLYRVPWLWSDKSQTSFRHEGFVKLNNYLGYQHCIIENPSHQWADDDCVQKRVFICQQVVRTATTVRMTAVTDANLTDPAINAQILQQLGALLTSQGWTDFKMQWKILPKKKDQNECTELQCNAFA